MAELSWEKTRKSGLQLRSVQTNVNRMQPIDADKFEGEVRDLIKERLADHMKGYVERGLRKFIEDKAVAIMSSGKQTAKISSTNDSTGKDLRDPQNSIRVFIYRCFASTPRKTICLGGVTETKTSEIKK